MILILLLLQIFFSQSLFASNTNLRQEIYPITECNDGIDNEGDGGIDFATDPECTSWTDTSESYIAPVSVPVSTPTPTPIPSTDDTGSISPVISSIRNSPVVDTFITQPTKLFRQNVWEPLADILGVEENSEERISFLSGFDTGFALFLGVIYVLFFVVVFFLIYKRVGESKTKGDQKI